MVYHPVVERRLSLNPRRLGIFIPLGEPFRRLPLRKNVLLTSGHYHLWTAQMASAFKFACNVLKCPKMRTTNTNSAVQLSLFPSQGNSVEDNREGCILAARVTNYMKTREALWRMIASYPKGMPVQDAIIRARVDFTKRRKEVAI